ncbi:putative peptidyl-prolyl cis-trans isomerase [Planctomycetes bacterium K2D]|uniref:peptidylprolyl isomerase n=2 Tax=Botrimarina mediterranea TaxID=2528022 RepID=A0A518K2P4_9BACT|nr:putative peptidyl-prolyl cis-trans isomerase [Botrimarina mediterranea]QDV76627.1 putative peptidyl-prolyl cis-trans isomerase [Planctomycetes bacterium K2D]
MFRSLVAAMLLGFAVTEVRADAAADYNAALADYRATFSEIEKLFTEYQAAGPDRRKVINEQLKPLGIKAKTKLNAMTQAALEVYKADPNGDPKITELLLTVVDFDIVGGPNGGGDQYEEALPIIEALVEGGEDKPVLPLWGVLAAICTNDFDKADEFAKKAVEMNSLKADPGQSEAAQDVFSQAVRYLQEKDRFRKRWEAEKKVRDAEAAADNNPRVKFTLEKGDIVIELFEDQAPIATANMITLVKDGFYDGIVFHRVLPNFMAQGGDPTGKGSGGPGYSIACECYRPDARKHFRGSLSMAHAGKDTGGSQFFLCFVPTDFLDGKHTAFGRVVEGMELLGEIQRIDPDKPTGAEPDKIVNAEVVRDRGHAYEFKKLPER